MLRIHKGMRAMSSDESNFIDGCRKAGHAVEYVSEGSYGWGNTVGEGRGALGCYDISVTPIGKRTIHDWDVSADWPEQAVVPAGNVDCDLYLIEGVEYAVYPNGHVHELRFVGAAHVLHHHYWGRRWSATPPGPTMTLKQYDDMFVL